MNAEDLMGDVETRMRQKVMSLEDFSAESKVYTNGKLYAAISTRFSDFELSPHTKSSKSELSSFTGLIRDSNGIAEHAGFVEVKVPVGQIDIGAIYYISVHLDYISCQVDRLNRSLMAVDASHRDILHNLHTSLLASLKQAGCDFNFALRNLDTIMECQLHSTYMPSIVSGIQHAERALHETALHWEKRLRHKDADDSEWRKMPAEVEGSLYFKCLFVTAVGHATQALLLNGNEHVLALSRLKLRELAKPLMDILVKFKEHKDWIHSVLSKEYEDPSGFSTPAWGRDSPDDQIAKLIAHADRMIEAINYLVSLSFVDWLSSERKCGVLDISNEQRNIISPLPVPDAVRNLMLG